MPRHSDNERRRGDTTLTLDISAVGGDDRELARNLRRARSSLESCERAVERATRALRRVGDPGVTEMGGGDG